MNTHLTTIRAMLCGLLLSPAVAVMAGGLEPLGDRDMASVTGQEGIALDLELRVNADSTGTALASMGDCTGLGNGCILALQFANRNAGGGEWLVLKDMYGVLRLNDFQLDGSRLPATPSANANPSRFEGTGGTCLIAGCDPSGDLAASLSFPAIAGFNTDIEWALNVGRAAVQFGAQGYLPSADNGASFVALRVNDTQTNTARIDLDGRIQLFGF